MDRFETGFGRWVVRRRWWILSATLLVFFAAANGASRLSFNSDGRVFISKDNPQLQALEALEATYTKDNTVVFVLAPAAGDVFTRPTLAAVEELTEAAWQMPYSSRVDSLTNFQHTRAEDDELIVEDLVRHAERFSEQDLERVRAIALAEPELVDRVVSRSGDVTAVTVTLFLPGESLAEVPEVAAFARQTADDLGESSPGLKLYLAGTVMSDAAFGEAGQRDMATLIPLMWLTLVVIVGLALRSFWGTLATLVVILASMFTGLGLAGWLGIKLTAASVNAPTIILTLAVADSVHLLASLFQEMRRGRSRHAAVAESLRVNLQPVFLTSATTAIGFLTMNFSDAPPFRDLGNIVAMGVAAALLYSVLFLPALMAVLPLRVKPRAKAGNNFFDGLARFVVARRQAFFWGTVAAAVLLSAGIARIELYDDWMKYFDESFEIRQAFDFVDENLSGTDVIEYSLESGEPGGISDPEYLATIAAFADWYRQQPKVIHVATIAETMTRLNQNMHGDDPSFARLPERRDLAAQYLLLYEMSLPFGLDLNNRIDVEKSATRMTVTLRDVSTRELPQLDERARRWLRTNAPESMFTYGSGLSIIWAHISRRNIDSMLGAAFAALVLISVLLIFALRSVKLGLLSLIPNLAPAFMAFGVWGFAVGRVGLGLSVIAAMTLGIVVDDTVHFMSKYLRARRERGTSPERAVRYAFQTVGPAITVTTLALVAGFMVLSLSGYKMNSDMALMTALTIILALALDMLFLPTLLIKLESEKSDEKIDLDIDLVPLPVAAAGGGRDA